MLRLRCLLFDSFLIYFSNFPNYDFFQKGIYFSNATFKDCFQLTSTLFCSEKTRLEIQTLITIVLSWPTWRISNARANFILKTDLPELAEAPHLPKRFHYSQRQNEENHKDVHGKGMSKIKEKLISHLNLNLVVLHDSSLSLSAAHFFIICTTDRNNLLF